MNNSARPLASKMRPSTARRPLIVRYGVSGILGLLPVCLAIPQIKEDPRQAYRRLEAERWERFYAFEKRIKETHPVRRDTPLRYLNIRDSEVQEIRVAAYEVFPGEMVYISAVVTGCPCEEGSACSDQVWVTTDNKNETFDGILLSKIEEQWKIGPIQRWWLERERLIAKQKQFKDYYAYRDAEEALILRFPACPKEIARLMGTPFKPK